MANAELQAIAEKLVECCKTQKEAEALDTLYAENAQSIEAGPGMDGSPALTSGMDGIRGKHAWWAENFEVHDFGVDGPFLHGDTQFAVLFDIDATHKPSGQRTKMSEVAIYTIGAEGKIVTEAFFNRPS